MLEQRKIPRTDLEVSALCLSTMTFGTPVGEREGIEIVQRALDLGVDFIDTDNMYEGYARYIGSPGGVAEEILGKALIRMGKVRHWGLSNFDAAQTRQVLQVCDRERWPRPVAHQPPYSLLKRDIESIGNSKPGLNVVWC